MGKQCWKSIVELQKSKRLSFWFSASFNCKWYSLGLHFLFLSHFSHQLPQQGKHFVYSSQMLCITCTNTQSRFKILTNNEIATNSVLVLEHPRGKGIEEQQLYATMLVIRLWAKQYHCWKNRICCSFSIKSVEKK